MGRHFLYHRKPYHNPILPPLSPSLPPPLLSLPLPPSPPSVSLPSSPCLPSFPSVSLSPSAVCNDHHFKDDFLFYRFVNDDSTPRSIKEKLGLGGSRQEKHKVEDATVREQDSEIYSEVGPETEESEIADG